MPKHPALIIQIRNMTFSFDSMPQNLFENISLNLPSGWTGVVGANGSGKTTFLLLLTGNLLPVKGLVNAPDRIIYCSQRTDDPPNLFEEFMENRSETACRLKGLMGIKGDWLVRWDTLSHGERKKAQIATALWFEPELLAVDEPTNHLDLPTKEAVHKALSSFKGIGLLVSHDRDLLDGLCDQCVFVEPPNAILRPGGVTKGLEAARLENEYLKKQREILTGNFKRLRTEMNRRKQKVAEDQKKRSKGKLDRKDSDGREKIDMAIVSGRDAVAGRLFGRMKSRVSRAKDEMEKVRYVPEKELGFWLETSVSRKDCLLRLEEGRLPLGNERALFYPPLEVGPKDRIALTGPNGSGKSTLVRKVMISLNIDEERTIYIPQEIDASASVKLLNEARSLPGPELGRLMIIIDGLGSEPKRLLGSELPSPGETRKLLLAIGMVRGPHMIILDEPTNHMDLPSIRCLEKALSECPCALILVSHDLRFLDKLAILHWKISPEKENKDKFCLRRGWWEATADRNV